MPLAAYTDANSWLDGTRISFESDADAKPEAENAENVVKSHLFDVFPDLVSAWETPEATPAIVREITAMLMAAFRYARKYSAESVKKDSYSKWLQDTAMMELSKLES